VSEKSQLQLLKPPGVGDEVLYLTDGHWYSAEVVAIHRSGRLSLLYNPGTECICRQSAHGAHERGWLTYLEAAAGVAASTAQEVATSEY
jgi:hypothetical protein